MRKFFYVAALSLALAGCGADQPPETAAPAATKHAAATAKSVHHATRPHALGIDAALKAVSRKAPTSIRYDRVVQDKAGHNLRQVFVEMLGASATETEALVTKALASSGFSVRRGKNDANGIRLQYQKKGAQPINVLIRDKKASPPLKVATATASLYLRQNVL